MQTRALRLAGPTGPLTAELLVPMASIAPIALMVFAHGAGAGFRHSNMCNIAQALAVRGIASLRFNFPFMQAGRRRVDNQTTSIAAINAALEAASEVTAGEGLPLYLGGHSFGGRMASHAAVECELAVNGLIFCSFPLHQPKQPSLDRAQHLPLIHLPMLFLSGTRDALAEPQLLEQVVAGLGGRAQLHWLATADHSYKILKRQRPESPSVFEEIAEVASDFIADH